LFLQLHLACDFLTLLSADMSARVLRSVKPGANSPPK